MSTNTLPSFGSFGLEPDDLELQEIDPDAFEAFSEEDEDLPLGKDLLFDFNTFSFDPAGTRWIRVCGEAQALFQWIVVALKTPRGRSILYPAEFGSDLEDILALGLSPRELVAEVPEAIKGALLQHDRIEDIRNINFFSEGEGLLEVGFDVILDDDAVLNFQAALPFGV